MIPSGRVAGWRGSGLDCRAAWISDESGDTGSSRPLRSPASRNTFSRMAKLNGHYFGMGVGELADLLKANGCGVFSAEYADARKEVAAGEEIRAAKSITELSGCSIADAQLSIELLKKHGS